MKKDLWQCDVLCQCVGQWPLALFQILQVFLQTFS